MSDHEAEDEARRDQEAEADERQAQCRRGWEILDDRSEERTAGWRGGKGGSRATTRRREEKLRVALLDVLSKFIEESDEEDDEDDGGRPVH